jgi:hypothetical protein
MQNNELGGTGRGNTKPLDALGGRVPPELQDELAILYERGYTPTEVIKEGIRCCSDKEGVMVRRRETMAARPLSELMHVTG